MEKMRVPPTSIRMPAELKVWLGKQAVANHRSLSNEVVFRLEQSRKEQDAREQKGGR